MSASDTELPASQNLVGVQRASYLLRQILLADKARKIWSAYLPERISQDTQVLSYRAIARAISAAEHLKYGSDDIPSRYKDRVRRAILGQRMTADTLQLFADTFDFSSKQIEDITTSLIAESKVPHSPNPTLTQHLFFNITSSFYDVYVNKDYRVYRLDCSLVVRAINDGVDHIWVTKSKDIVSVTVLEGGQTQWVEEQGAWKLVFPHQLSALESIKVRYVLEVTPEPVQEEILALRCLVPRPVCFFRFFFDEAEKLPRQLKMSRNSADGQEKNNKTQYLPLHGQHASVYIDQVGQEVLNFVIDN